MNKRYLTGPLSNSTLTFILSLFGFILLIVSIVFWQNWAVLALTLGIYLVVVVAAVLANRYLTKGFKE